MIAIFYDRKHRREVASDMLVRIKLVEQYASCGEADDATRPKLKELRNSSRVIGELGYKSPSCPSWQNWDRYLMTHDLVFLRLEDEPVRPSGNTGEKT